MKKNNNLQSTNKNSNKVSNSNQSNRNQISSKNNNQVSSKNNNHISNDVGFDLEPNEKSFELTDSCSSKIKDCK